MQVAFDTPSSTHADPALQAFEATAQSALAHYQILRRNGSVAAFEPQKIAVALMKATAPWPPSSR